MNAWEILGIEPTKDKKEIKKAYARLLKQYHPEENPEEFKQIQAVWLQSSHSNCWAGNVKGNLLGQILFFLLLCQCGAKVGK